MKRKGMVGFSLIELMISVAVIGILSAIAIPSYKEHLVKTRRSAAMAALVQAGSAMDRYRLQNNTYVGGTFGGIGADQYALSIQATGLNNFTLRATPIAGTAQDGDGMIELDSSGGRRWDEDDAAGFDVVAGSHDNFNWKSE